MKYSVKKTWHGHVSVRDYIIKKCRDREEDLIIDYNGEEMTVPWKSLSNPRILNPKKIKSKYSRLLHILSPFYCPIKIGESGVELMRREHRIGKETVRTTLPSLT